MRIELKAPYSRVWRKGYLVVNPDGRRTVILFNSSKDRSSVSYARYLLSVKLGRFLGANEHVDHVDNDKTNDSEGNLQILSPAENNRKSARGRSMTSFTCPVCGVYFTVETRQAYNKTVKCCSRRCGGVYSHRK